MEKDSPFVFAKIIGPEKPNDSALRICQETLKKTFVNYVDEQDQIPFDCVIYLIAHGKSSMHCQKAGIDYNDKGSPYIVGIIKKLLGHLNSFSGRIILQMCFSAEPMADKDTVVKAREIQAEEVQNFYERYLKLKVKVGSPSLLFEVQQELKEDRTFMKKLDNSCKIGGYLGLSNDGDFRISGYSVSSTFNPLTEEFQRGRKIVNERTTMGVTYNEQQSFLEVCIGKKLPFGS